MDLLQGIIQPYDWGDDRAIADMLGHEPPGHPEAEYWLGAHPKAPSRLVGADVGLDEVLAANPAEVLGDRVAGRFGAEFPFLLKLLAAAQPLSIQAHPTAAQAAEGFAREDEAGIDRSAPNRNYRDPNHKPELMCALTPFEAKCGFRDIDATRALLDRLDTPALDPLRDRLAGPADSPGTPADRLSEAVTWLLTLPSGEAAKLVAATVEAASAAAGETGSDFEAELVWTGRIAETFGDDIGVVVALLLNHVTMAPGEAVFLGAGNLHAYLSGFGVELMANSDNVLRGGLTPKHIDIAELTSTVDYSPIEAPIQRPSGPVHHYDTPVEEFGLVRYELTVDDETVVTATPTGPEILLITDGRVRVSTEGDTIEAAAGSAVLVTPGDGAFTLAAIGGEAELFRATVGDITTTG